MEKDIQQSWNHIKELAEYPVQTEDGQVLFKELFKNEISKIDEFLNNCFASHSYQFEQLHDGMAYHDKLLDKDCLIGQVYSKDEILIVWADEDGFNEEWIKFEEGRFCRIGNTIKTGTLRMKEYANAIEQLETAYYNLDNSLSALKSFSKNIELLYCLLKEFFDPQPYKFEDLREGMEIYDLTDDEIIKITLILDEKQSEYLYLDKTKKIFFNGIPGQVREFEEGRYFPLIKAMCKDLHQ